MSKRESGMSGAGAGVGAGVRGGRGAAGVRGSAGVRGRCRGSRAGDGEGEGGK